jgi:hypothetical protein
MRVLESWSKATTFQFVVNNMTQCDSILDLQWDSLDHRQKKKKTKQKDLLSSQRT